MDQSKGLSAVSYLSFYFAPFILPLILFFVTKDDFVKHHSKKAFITQLIPIVLVILFIIIFFASALSWNEPMMPQEFLAGPYVIGFFLLVAVTGVLAIWNLVQAINVLR